MSAEVLGGAAQGAAAGAVVGGPVGAVIGGVVGAIGGLFKSKSKKAARKANATKQQMDDIQNAVIRRNQLREAFIMRQTALAAGAAETGGTESSTVQGALGSLGSQLGYNTRYFDTQQANINVFNKYAKQSAKYADYAGVVEQAGQAAMTIAKYRGGGTTAKPSRAAGQYDAPWGVLGDPSTR